MPNGAACIPQLVAPEKLESANGVMQAVHSLSGIAAPIVGGVLYGAMGLQSLVVISGAAFALAAVAEMFIKIPFVKRDRTGGVVRTIVADVREGFIFVWNDSFIRKMMTLAALLNLVLVPCFFVMAPLVLRITMNSGETLYGAGMGIIEAAMIIGALLLGVFGKKLRADALWRWILAIAILFAPLALSVSPMALRWGFMLPFALFLLSISLMAAATTILSVFVVTRIQVKTPQKNLGKAMAIIQMVAQCAAPAGQLAYGFMFERFTGAVYTPLLLVGFLTAGIGLVGKIILIKEDLDNEANDNNT
jgi:MFS family permease